MAFFDLLSPVAQVQQGPGIQEFVDSVARTPLSQVVMVVAVLTVFRLAFAPYLKNTKPHLRDVTYAAVRLLNEFFDAIIYAGIFVFMVIRPFGVQAFLIPSGSMWATLHVHDFIVANKAIYRYSDPKRGDIVVFRPPVEAIFPEKKSTDIDADGEVKVDFIKRCIGLPGDLIELKKGILYRNGEKVDETYIHYSSTRDNDEFTEKTPEEKANLTYQNFKFVKLNGKLVPLNYTDFDANAAQPSAGNITEGLPYSVAEVFQLHTQEEMKQAESLPAERIPKGYYLMLGDNRNNSFDGRSWGLVARDRIIGRSEVIWMPISRIGRTR